jgi:hypothetical protein
VRRWCHRRKQSWKSFSEYLVLTSLCFGCQECQQIFVLSGHFFSFGKSQKSQGAVRWIRRMVHFCNGFLSELFNASYSGHCHGGESTCQARVRVFSSERIPTTLSALPNNTVESPFVLVQWIHSELSPHDRRNTQAWSWTASKTCMLFFRPRWILCFPLHILFCFRVILKAPPHQ